jgi:hypothetical protein
LTAIIAANVAQSRCQRTRATLASSPCGARRTSVTAGYSHGWRTFDAARVRAPSDDAACRGGDGNVARPRAEATRVTFTAIIAANVAQGRCRRSGATLPSSSGARIHERR